MPHHPLLRALRWIALAAAAPAIWACNARSFERPTLKPDQTIVKTFQSAINRDVDLLFMIDNSSSMQNSQDNLRANFPTFMTTLAAPPGLPNIHVAVVSSDMGAGYGGDAIPGCSASGGLGDPGGDKGIFLSGVPRGTGAYTPTVPCATTGLDPGATFISNIGGQANYAGKLEDVFSCIAALGQNGCGFEHQFASVLRALGADGRPAPEENAGFLRPEAYLVVVMITNEDDCSSLVEPQFFEPQSNWSQGSQLGEAFRCNEFGHLCSMDGQPPFVHPSRTAPGNDVSATVSYASCISNETDGYLLGVKETANRLKALKDPGQVLVAAITGAPAPYTVHWQKSDDTSCSAASCPWPVISHVCGTDDTAHADPAVRISQLVREFDDNGLESSICESSFAGSLQRLGELINIKLKPPCITRQVASKPGTSDPDCTVVSHGTSDTGAPIDAAVSYCGANGGLAPCWQLKAGICDDGSAGQIVEVSVDPSASTGTAQNATVNCSLVLP